MIPSRGFCTARMLVPGTLGLLVGCAWLPGWVPPEPAPEGEPEEVRFHRALDAAEREDFKGASRALGELAGRCESGAWGRDAVLVLGALELSPRNPDGSPAAAAGLLSRFLQLPSAPASSLALAETLYLVALDLGADPVTDPFAPRDEVPETAPRFTDCDGGGFPAIVRPLPQPPGPTTTRADLHRASVERDSLAAVTDSLVARSDSLAARVDSLARRTADLEAELERIRRLLLPDTARFGGGPDRRRP